MKKLFFSVFALSALMLSACSGSGENPSSAPSSEESSQAQSSSAQSSSAGQSSSAASSSSASSSSAAPAEVVTISGGATTVDIGAYVTFTATGPAGVAITWASDDTTVATVEDGVVTGVAAGTAKITATAGTASDYVYIEVTEPVPPVVRQLVYSTDPTYATDKHTAELQANGETEVKVIQLQLAANQYFYIDLGEGEASVRYRHYTDLKTDNTEAINTYFEDAGEEKNHDFKVKTAGLYNFYIKLAQAEGGTIWADLCDPVPEYTKYQVKIDGTAYELKASDDKAWYKEQYILKDGNIAVTAGDSITFEGYDDSWHDITASVTKNGDDETKHIYNNVKKVAGAYQIRKTADEDHKVPVYFQLDFKNKFGFWIDGGGEKPDLSVGYFLKGTMNDWQATEDEMLALRDDDKPVDANHQYYLKLDLDLHDEFKFNNGETWLGYDTLEDNAGRANFSKNNGDGSQNNNVICNVAGTYEFFLKELTAGGYSISITDVTPATPCSVTFSATTDEALESGYSLYVVGDFNSWAVSAEYKLTETAGVWSGTFTINTGHYEFKFVRAKTADQTEPLWEHHANHDLVATGTSTTADQVDDIVWEYAATINVAMPSGSSASFSYIGLKVKDPGDENHSWRSNLTYDSVNGVYTTTYTTTNKTFTFFVDCWADGYTANVNAEIVKTATPWADFSVTITGNAPAVINVAPSAAVNSSVKIASSTTQSGCTVA